MSAPLADAAWLRDAATHAVMNALGGAESPPKARFVGGCVRNALLGRPVGDIDIATELSPERVIELAAAAGLKPIATGLAHGTVTVVAKGRPFEVTTLRVDVRTHGRHADVAFTEDWEADAARRDFTMNALYADMKGEIFDPVGGLADLKVRHVRFIGDAGARIREDYLRILRFFRIHAWYGRGELDPEGLAACIAEKAGLRALSVERVWKELKGLLTAEDPCPALGAMAETGILASILPEARNMETVRRLIELERAAGLKVCAMQRLAALMPAERDCAAAAARRLKLSNREREMLAALAGRAPSPRPDWDDGAIRRFLFEQGEEEGRGAIVLAAAESAGPRAYLGVIQSAMRLAVPVFPLGGKELMSLGVEPGPGLGSLLGDLKAWWAERDFAPGTEALLVEARRRLCGEEGN